MTIENLGKISITPKGQWVAGVYERLDMVTDAGSSYISLKDNNVSALNTADWMLVAEKGDAFEYDDFTPEQIATLQQPATDIASTVSQAEGLRVTAEQGRATAEGLRVTAESNRSGAELLRAGAEDTREMNEYNREDAEALRVQAEIDRQTNTGTAIQNADTATQNASDAATLANTKAGLADSKATLADTKAGLANDAASLANTKAGLADTAANTANNAATAISPSVINNEQVQAETYNVLNASISALEALLANMVFANATINKVDIVNEFNIWGTTNLIKIFAVVPAITPDFVGQIYINTATNKVYISTAIVNSGSWQLLN